MVVLVVVGIAKVIVGPGIAVMVEEEGPWVSINGVRLERHWPFVIVELEPPHEMGPLSRSVQTT